MKSIGTGHQNHVHRLKRSRFFFLFLGLYILGSVCGAGAIKEHFLQQGEEAAGMLTALLQFYQKDGFLAVLLNRCGAALGTCFFLFLLGFFALGTPLLFLFPFWKGLGTGYLTGFFYLTFSWQGMGYALLTVLLPAGVFLPVAFYGWKEALFSAGRLFRSCCDAEYSQKERMKKQKRYCARFGVLCLVLLLYGALESLVLFLFCEFFH